MSKMIRAFIAAALPETMATSLQEVQRRLKKDRLPVRWVKPGNIHLTLKFFGDIHPEEITRVTHAMERVCREYAPLTLRTSGLGVFPNHRRPKVLWAGVTGDTRELGTLVRALDSELSKIGFSAEKRPFRSHLTIGRFKGAMDSGRIIDLLKRWDSWGAEASTFDCIHLFESRLKPGGAEYMTLASIPLAKPGGKI